MITNRLIKYDNSVFSDKELINLKTDKKTIYHIDKNVTDSKKEEKKNDK